MAGTVPAAAGNVTTREERIEAWDGKQLAAIVYEPPGSELVLTMLMTHGYGETKADISREATYYAENNYLAVGFDSRGFEEPEGVSDFSGHKKVRYLLALLDWLAAHDRVLMTTPDNSSGNSSSAT